ncbi:TolC family protein [Polaribacter sp.]|uniref:TolC family protein n=1 Tax=Polaribacter sp. TaxID=1920175 RepID=UPI0040480334
MNKSFSLLCSICFFIVSFHTIKAQNNELNDLSLKGIEFKFPPLEVVIDSALKHSAMLKFRNNHIGVTESTLASERIYWTRNFGIQADSRYGNLSNFAMNDDGATNTAALTIARQFNYSVGVYLKFPVFDALNRKNQIKLATLEVEEAKSMAEFTKEEIRQTVIRLYQDLILKQKLLEIRSRSLGDGRVNMEMVEKEFRNGIVPLSEYVRINGMSANLEADYEKAKSEFITAKQLLEDIAGFVFELKK